MIIHKFLIIFVFLLIGTKVFGQITFPQNVYSVNEEIVVYGTSFVTLVENGIAGSTEPIPLLTDKINLGSTSQPGLYWVSFCSADNSRQTFLILVKDITFDADSSVVDFLNSPVMSDEQKNIFVQLFNFFKDKSVNDRFNPFINALKNYSKENPVNIIHNVAFCFAAVSADGSLEMLDVICKDMSEDNLKDLLVEVYKEIFKEMLNDKYISKAQYDDLKINDYVSLTKILKKDCSGFFDFFADKIENDNLKIAMKYEGQLCSSTIAVIKEYKMP